jgi:hypothetical protein
MGKEDSYELEILEKLSVDLLALRFCEIFTSFREVYMN